MLSFSVLALFGSLLASSAVASPTPSPVTPSKCVTYGKGTLKTAELTNTNGQFNGKFSGLLLIASVLSKLCIGQHKPFAFNYRGQLSFYHATQHNPIQAEFQVRSRFVVYSLACTDFLIHPLDLHAQLRRQQQHLYGQGRTHLPPQHETMPRRQRNYRVR